MEEITFKVSSLAEATSLYESALRPLNYGCISSVEHSNTHGRKLSSTVAFGPTGSKRVDLVLSQSSHSRRPPPEEGPPRLCFHADDRHAVRDFYKAACNAGASPVVPPMVEGLRFHAIVSDCDGNQIEAACSEREHDVEPIAQLKETASTNDDNSKIEQWIDDMPRNMVNPVAPEYTSAPRYVAEPASFIPPSHYSPPSQYQQYANTRRRSPYTTGQGSHSDHGYEFNVKNIIAGAATAGVVGALAYGAYKEVTDSKEREDDYNRMLHRRSQIEEEARAHARYADDIRRTRSRDSGYYSINEVTTTHVRKHKPLSPTKEVVTPRAPSHSRRDPIRSETYPQPSRRSEISSGASTVKPLRRSDPRPAPTRSSRRESEPAASDRSNYYHMQPPSKPSRPLPPPAPSAYREPQPPPRRSSSSHAPSADTSKSSVKKLQYYRAETRGPSNASSKHTDRPPSKQDSRAPSRSSTSRPPSSNYTARYAPLPASNIGSRRTSSTVRTARANTLPRNRADRALHDLASVTCDDSASNVGTRRSSRMTSGRG